MNDIGSGGATLSNAGTTEKLFTVVYQMGKVASTSIVATLKEIDGVEAVQAHFLGEKSLSSMVAQITSPDLSEYFFRHSLGQFIENMKITRRINMVRSGKIPDERLLVISLSRDPVEWARSSIVQDITGYLPTLKSLCDSAKLYYTTDAGAVSAGLHHLMEQSCDLLIKFGGIDGFLSSPKTYAQRFEGTIFDGNSDTSRILLMLLRPANWFDSHFEPSLSLYLKDMTKSDFTWSAVQDHAHFVIVRYEDMAEQLPKWLGLNGLCDITDFKRENLSDAKEHAAEVASVFRSDVGERLKAAYSDTRYSKFFGYV